MRYFTAACAALFMGAAGTAHAAWKGTGEVGVVLARGNTNATTVNVKFEGSNQVGRWKHTVAGAALKATGEDADTGLETDTAERYFLMGQSDWAITTRAFTFGNARFDEDRFSGFDYQASAAIGLGYKFIDTARTQLSGQLGAGARQLRNSLTDVESRDFIFRGDVNFTMTLTATTKIINKLAMESGAENRRATNDLSLQVKMTDRLALGVGIGLQYNSDPPEPLQKTDTLTTLNLVYAFGH